MKINLKNIMRVHYSPLCLPCINLADEQCERLTNCDQPYFHKHKNQSQHNGMLSHNEPHDSTHDNSCEQAQSNRVALAHTSSQPTS